MAAPEAGGGERGGAPQMGAGTASA